MIPNVDERALELSKRNPHTGSCKKTFDLIRSTFLDQWPEKVWKLTIPMQARVEIPLEWVDELCEIGARKEGVVEKRICEVLEPVMDGRPYFVRLNSSSPKDFTFPKMPVFKKPQDVVEALFNSQRTLDDMLEMRNNSAEVYIYFRPYIKIFPGTEFRCFVQDRHLRGISEYEPSKSDFPRVRKDDITKSILEFTPRVVDAFNQDEFVYDVFFPKSSAQQKTLRPVLIEINPYGLSDLCLFESYETIGGYAYNKPSIEQF